MKEARAVESCRLRALCNGGLLMDRAGRWVSRALLTRRGRLRWLAAGLTLFGPACSQPIPLVAAEPVRVIHARAAAPEVLPPVPAPKAAPQPAVVKALPISMD